MSASDVQKIEAILPRLAVDELEQVRKRIASLKGLASNAPADKSVKEESETDFVLSIIATTLQARGVGTQSVPMMKRSSGYARFREKVPPLMAYLARSCRRRHVNKRLTFQTILLIGVDLLYQAMSQQGLSTSSNMMMKHIHRVPEIFDHHFPGYAEMGLLHYLATG